MGHNIFLKLAYYLQTQTNYFMSNRIKTQMKFNADNSIEGIFILPDKSITNFFVTNDGNYEQWGNTLDNQNKTINDLVSLIQLFIHNDK